MGEAAVSNFTRLTSLSILGSSASDGADVTEAVEVSSARLTRSTLLAGVTLDDKPCVAVFQVTWKALTPSEKVPSPPSDGGAVVASSLGGEGKMGVVGGGTTKKVLPTPPANQNNTVGLVIQNLISRNKKLDFNDNY